MAHRFSFRFLISVGALAMGCTAVWAQQGGRGGAPAAPLNAPPNAQAVAPVDLTGYWVSVITEDGASVWLRHPREISPACR